VIARYRSRSKLITITIDGPPAKGASRCNAGISLALTNHLALDDEQQFRVASPVGACIAGAERC
jgi:hypothetical protein